MAVYSADEIDDSPTDDKPEIKTVAETGEAGGKAPAPVKSAGAPAKDRGVAGAQASAKKAAAKKTAVAKKTADEKVAADKAEAEAKAIAEAEAAEAAIETPGNIDVHTLPKVVMKIGEVQSEVTCLVTHVVQKILSGQEGLEIELDGQWTGKCYSLLLNQKEILEQALESNTPLDFQLEGRESKKVTGACVVLVVGVDVLVEPEVEEDPGL